MHETHETGCYNAGITPNSYAYAQYVSINDAITESNDFYNRMGNHSVACFVDVEEVTTDNPDDLIPATQAFIDNLHSKGLTKVGLYTGQSFYHTYGLSAINCDFKVIAKYGSNNGLISGSIKPDIACDLWQYSSKCVVSGFPNPIDGQVLNGSKTLDYFMINNPDEPTGDNPPTVSNYNVTTEYNTQCSGQVIGSDIDGDPLSYSKSRSPYNGVVVVNIDGTWSYTPNTGYVGQDSFKVLVDDGTGNSATSSITIVVNSPSLNPTPVETLVYTQYLTINNSVPIYSESNVSSNLVTTIIDKYSIVWFATGQSQGLWAYIKYIDRNGVTYFGYVDLTKIDTLENIQQKNQYSSEYHIVLSGETIESIASSYGLTKDQIMQLNGLRGAFSINVGQSLKIN